MRAPRRGRPEAAEAIWNWRGGKQPAGSGSVGRPRLRGAIQAAVGAAVGTAFWLFKARVLASVALSFAVVLLASALISPGGLYAMIERAFRALGHHIGRGLSWLLLPAIFYVFFFPFGRLFRRGRRDVMKRSFDAEADTYWAPHRLRSTAASYRQQF